MFCKGSYVLYDHVFRIFIWVLLDVIHPFGYYVKVLDCYRYMYQCQHFIYGYQVSFDNLQSLQFTYVQIRLDSLYSLASDTNFVQMFIITIITIITIFYYFIISNYYNQ
jgi:hypothetical protein